MKVRLIDQLLSLPWSPLDLFDARTFSAAKFEWLFALLCVLLPLATAFPPASLKVVILELPQLGEGNHMTVPWVNLTYRRDEGWGATEMSALFRSGSDFEIA